MCDKIVYVHNFPMMLNPSIRPVLRKVEPEFGNSFVLRNFSETMQGKVPGWHYHPEIELVFMDSGRGKRHIGNHIGYYNDGDLIMIGSDLPHHGFPSKPDENKHEIVMQIHPACFGDGFFNMVETSSIAELFERSKMGLSFHGGIKREIGERLKSMFYMTSFERMVEVIKIFHKLSVSDEYNILNASGHAIVVQGNDGQRIELVYDFVRKYFKEEVSLNEIAKEVSMTVPAFCRFFKRTTGKTFISFLNEYRITHACKLIFEEQQNISSIAMECGFNNLSNFNRAFRKVTGQSPSGYRRRMRKVVN